MGAAGAALAVNPCSSLKRMGEITMTLNYLPNKELLPL